MLCAARRHLQARLNVSLPRLGRQVAPSYRRWRIKLPRVPRRRAAISMSRSVWYVRMSALGQLQTRRPRWPTSAWPRKPSSQDAGPRQHGTSAVPTKADLPFTAGREPLADVEDKRMPIHGISFRTQADNGEVSRKTLSAQMMMSTTDGTVLIAQERQHLTRGVFVRA